MKAYLRMYRWAMQMKLHMAMYTFVAIFLKAVTNLLQGMKQMDIMELLSMWGAVSYTHLTLPTNSLV